MKRRKLIIVAVMALYTVCSLPVWFWGRCRWTWRRGRRPGTARTAAAVPARAGAWDIREVMSARQPVVLRGVLREWQAFEALHPEPLRARYGAQRIAVYHNPPERAGFLQETATWRAMPYAAFLDAVFAPDGCAAGRYYCRDSTPTRELMADLDQLARPRPLDHCGVWIGSPGNITPVHCDPWPGFLGQVTGRKRVVLFRPGAVFSLSPKPFLSRHYNTTPPTRLPDDFRAADPHSCPHLAGAERFTTVLEPGDLLHIPPCWWHQVDSLDGCVSIVFRYAMSARDLLGHPETLMLAWGRLLHLLRISRDPTPPRWVVEAKRSFEQQDLPAEIEAAEKPLTL